MFVVSMDGPDNLFFNNESVYKIPSHRILSSGKIIILLPTIGTVRQWILIPPGLIIREPIIIYLMFFKYYERSKEEVLT